MYKSTIFRRIIFLDVKLSLKIYFAYLYRLLWDEQGRREEILTRVGAFQNTGPGGFPPRPTPPLVGHGDELGFLNQFIQTHS